MRHVVIDLLLLQVRTGTNTEKKIKTRRKRNEVDRPLSTSFDQIIIITATISEIEMMIRQHPGLGYMNYPQR